MNLKCKNCLQAICVDNTGHWASSVATGGRTCAKGDTAIGKHRLHEPDHPPRVIPCQRCRSAECETVVCDNSVPLHTAIRKCAERSAKRAEDEHALAAQFAREVEVAEAKLAKVQEWADYNAQSMGAAVMSMAEATWMQAAGKEVQELLKSKEVAK